MKKGNVLVIGNSGVGKSTLINAILGEEKAKTGWGTEGTTDRLEIYENENIPFRIIDSVGFEPSFIKRQKAINSVKKWSKASAEEGNKYNEINVIWFCIDGTARKLFSNTIKDLLKSISMWKTVPVIAVITKSYSMPERESNIEMVKEAFSKQKQYSNKLEDIVPVVADKYQINESIFVAPEGITELIDITNKIMPEGIKASEKDIYNFKLSRKRALAHSVVGVATASGVTVGAVPIPFADAVVLSPIEIGEINAIAKIYGIKKNDTSTKFINSIVEVGTISTAAKAAISALKVIPGINLAASVLNAIIAGSIIAAIGEGSIYVFEKIYTGEKSMEDIDWMKKVMESNLSSQFVEQVTIIAEKISKSNNKKDIGKMITSLLSTIFHTKDK